MLYTSLALPRLADRHDPAGCIPIQLRASRLRHGDPMRSDAMRCDATRCDASRASARAATLFKTIYNQHTNQRTSHPVRVLALSAFSRHRRAPLRGSVSVTPSLPSIV